MSRRRRPGKLAVALASSGLTSCSETGSVDPAPPPLRCEDVGEGQRLLAEATVTGQTLTAVITEPDAAWTEATVSDVQGASVVSVETSFEQVTIVLALDAPPPTGGSFTLSGVLQGFAGGVCQVQRTFDFTVDEEGAQIALIHRGGDSLPLAGQHRAEITLVASDGQRLELEGRTSYRGPHELSWRVSGGKLEIESGSRAVWDLPSEPGFYQVELMADCGDGGLAIDWLAFEVT